MEQGSPRSPLGSPGVSEFGARSQVRGSPGTFQSPTGTGPRGSPLHGAASSGRKRQRRHFRGDLGTLINSNQFAPGAPGPRNLDEAFSGVAGEVGTDQSKSAGHIGPSQIDMSRLKKDFTKFIRDWVPEDQASSEGSYLRNLRLMWENVPDGKLDQQMQFPLDCSELYQHSPDLYQHLVNFPADIITLMDRVLWEVSLKILKETDRQVQEEADVRLRVKTYNLKTDDFRKMRDLEPTDIEKLISTNGIVIRCSDLIPDMAMAMFACTTEGCSEQVQVAVNKFRVFEPQRCDGCGQASSFILRHNQCEFGNKQYVKLQETPESIPAGETPQTIQLYCFDDLYDSMKPGDRVEITGILRASSQRTNFMMRRQRAVYRTFVDAIAVRRENTGDKSEIKSEVFLPLSDESDLNPKLVGEELATLNRQIRNLARETDEKGELTIRQKLINSLAPSIHELEHVKRGLLCQLFEGTNKVSDDLMSAKLRGRFREQIHVLLCGDPSTAKSQLMTAVNKLATRGVITSGKGSSATGLTAYISKDPETRDIVLESGALVLSDRGVCGIDEFDKMDDSTRAVLNEAMEQQTVSVAKAGIVCSLNAKVSILATANPINSRYDATKTIMENINLPATLTSRFDLVYLMLDKQDPVADQLLARHIVGMFSQQGRQAEREPPIGRDLFRSYINFAKRRCRPRLQEDAQAELEQRYLNLRSGTAAEGAVCATPRMLESLIRLAEAFAKMELREKVTRQDVIDGYELLNEATFKSAVDPVTGKIDMQALRTGVSVRERQVMETGARLLQEMIKEDSMTLREAHEKVNQALQEKKLGGTLRFKHLREVVAGLVREGVIIQRADMLSAP
mmetsp:Transcript_11775/g.28567  ORF Transcript_11775/g.28567 Transcript_11775/m.28567 type:complete len:850 (-) Transcript_11775:579-3128(-)